MHEAVASLELPLNDVLCRYSRNLCNQALDRLFSPRNTCGLSTTRSTSQRSVTHRTCNRDTNFLLHILSNNFQCKPKTHELIFKLGIEQPIPKVLQSRSRKGWWLSLIQFAHSI